MTELSTDIRRSRKERVRDIQWEREFRDDFRDDWGRRHHHHHHHDRPSRKWDDERVREREVIYDSRGPARGYIR